MPQESHDQNFKNLFLDFPKEALEWILPETLQKWGAVRQNEFLRQEPKKRRLSEAHLALDMPILFSFERQQVLLWLVEFQEDKSKFSIYKLLRYTTDFMEAYPDALVIPTVLFSDRKHWRKNVMRRLNTELNTRIFLHFEYVFVKLFDFEARDYYGSQNPLVKILLPKMNYSQDERWEVIRQAYTGLFHLVSIQLFEKYRDFIDIYAEVKEEERERIYQEIEEHEDTIMIAQLLEEKGIQKGLQKGLQKGMQKGLQTGIQTGIQQGNTTLLSRQLTKKYHRSSEELAALLEGLNAEDLLELGEYLLDCETFETIVEWLSMRKHQKAENSALN